MHSLGSWCLYQEWPVSLPGLKVVKKEWWYKNDMKSVMVCYGADCKGVETCWNFGLRFWLFWLQRADLGLFERRAPCHKLVKLFLAGDVTCYNSYCTISYYRYYSMFVGDASAKSNPKLISYCITWKTYHAENWWKLWKSPWYQRIINGIYHPWVSWLKPSASPGDGFAASTAWRIWCKAKMVTMLGSQLKCAWHRLIF